MPEFSELYSKLKRHIEITGKSQSTLTNYSRCLATMALHFNCSPLELDKEQVLDYLHYLKSQSRTPSPSYFKHTVYGLSFAYKVMGLASKGIPLPSLKPPKKLPVVLNHEEIKRLLKAPQLLKHRLILAMLYGCGLRRQEVCNIKVQDVDFGLKTYLEAEKPYTWLFNGKSSTGQLQQFTGAGVRWVVKEAARKPGVKKHVTSHVLRHTYATHLLEMGLDIMTLKELLGHGDIQTTLVYLHVAQLGRGRAFNPLDKLYPQKGG